MAFDFKKEYKEFYLPGKTPVLVELPPIPYLAVRGKGDPNQEGGAYQRALELLYGMAYTIKMSPRSGHRMEGYFEYVVPPLEGFWWMEDLRGVDYSRKGDFHWISVIRLPDFVSRAEFDWAAAEATRKKKLDFSPVELLTVEEGLCVQCLHLGPFDDEPATVRLMEEFLTQSGYTADFSPTRLHHEIYLNDARKTSPDKLKTVIRHPVKRRS